MYRIQEGYIQHHRGRTTLLFRWGYKRIEKWATIKTNIIGVWLTKTSKVKCAPYSGIFIT